MSKKSRKRNRRLLKAAALIGGLAMMGRRKGTPAADVDSGRGGDSASAAARVAANAVTGTKYPGANKVVVADTSPIKKSYVAESRMTPHNRGVDYSNPTGTVGTNKTASIQSVNAARMAAPKGVMHPILNQNPYAPTRIHRKRGQSFSTGGRVKGGGKAKRGLGRAFTKAKK